MNFKIVGGSLSALLLAAALAGCTGGGNAGSGGGSGTAANFTGSDAIATVGSSTITRADLAQTLEGYYGDRVLPQLIDDQLLAEALKSKNLTVTDDEINAEIKRVEDQQPNIKAAIDAGGARADVIKNQVRRSLSLEKLITADIPANEAEEKKFFNTYSTYYGSPAQVKVGILAASTKTRADQLERSLKAKPDSFDSLVAEQKAKGQTDPIGAQSTTDTGRLQDINPNATDPTSKLLATAKKGTVLPVQALSPQGPFLIIKVVDRKEAVKPNYDQVKNQVAMDYKLAQVAEKEVKRNPTNPPQLEENVKRLIANLALGNPQTGEPGVKANLTDALTTIARPEESALLDKLRTAGTVQVSDATYKDVAKQYQPVGGAAGNTAANNSATGNSAAGNVAAGNAAAENTATANTVTENTAAANTATTNTAATNAAAGNSAAPSTP